MSAPPTTLPDLMRSIAEGEDARTMRMLESAPGLATASLQTGASRGDAEAWYLSEISHYVYAGDTALHIAAAAYRTEIVTRLLQLGAPPGARNRRGAEPLHYAADGVPGSRAWNPAAQAGTVERLVAHGADPNAMDVGGVTPLHRAVRTRCADAVAALLQGGADPSARNRSGSTPLQLAGRATGRGGSGSAAATAEQAAILRLLAPFGETA